MAGRRTTLRERLLGGERHLGVWILPLFLITALLSATVIGGLAVLYYGQQVRRLDSTTAGARQDLKNEAGRVNAETRRARADIRRQVREARESLSQQPPVRQPHRAGIYAISATQPDGEVRVGSAFAVFSNDTETFLVTSYATVELDRGGSVEGAEVFLGGGSQPARVHSVDAERDLALLVVEAGPVPVSRWRPADRAIRLSDTVFVVGVAGTDTPAVVQAQVAGISATVIIHDGPTNQFMAGGPILDTQGHVIGVSSMDYEPFGSVEGDLRYGVPIREVCVLILDCTESDLRGG